MEMHEQAARLAAASEGERAGAFAGLEQREAIELARALKAYYDEQESSDPAVAAAAAAALEQMAAQVGEPEISALAAWTAGMAYLDAGRMEEGIIQLDEASERFLTLNQAHAAASTQVSKLYGLAVLGRYEEAVETGLRARDVFLAHDDFPAAGKIAQNLGNIEFRRGDYPAAETHYRAALNLFEQAQDEKLLALAENGLANVLNYRYLFAEAGALYELALGRATRAGLSVQQAMIECNIGVLALHQGQYDRALDYLERSRRGYATLDLPHESAIAELEMADAYLALNLAPEAAAVYARITPLFAELGMQAEQAQATLHHGQAALLAADPERAQALLTEAQVLYAAEGNATGAALADLSAAQLAYYRDDFESAAAFAGRAETALAAAGVQGRALLARWLRGEALRRLGQPAEALLRETLADAAARGAPEVVHRCHTSLGLAAMSSGDVAAAEADFRAAIAVIENLRAPLPAEELRVAFVADKLTPYTEMVRLCLAAEDRQRAVEALDYAERARSRALLDMLSGAIQERATGDDPFEAELLRRLEALRAELHWLHSEINRPEDGESTRRLELMTALNGAVQEREAAVLEVTRQLQFRGASVDPVLVQPLNLAGLQQLLGDDTTLVEYFSLDGMLLAFVVDDRGVVVVNELARESDVEAALGRFRFQIDALRYGSQRFGSYLEQLTARARHYLRQLHALLVAPLQEHLLRPRVVFVPYRALHYVPFHALYDGRTHLIERHEVSYAPSAGVLQRCFDRPQRGRSQAFLLGAPDAQTPRVVDEVRALASIFPESTLLLEEQATLDSLRQYAPSGEIVHLACHGLFRPDNPLFSSLRLNDGWLTIRDVYSLRLNCDLVTLSACETGLSAVGPGDELLGLARGFFLAGAPTLIVSLWVVDDAATAELMTTFYTHLQTGARPAAALRAAQLAALRNYPHPFFWSPFVLVGRW